MHTHESLSRVTTGSLFCSVVLQYARILLDWSGQAHHVTLDRVFSFPPRSLALTSRSFTLASPPLLHCLLSLATCCGWILCGDMCTCVCVCVYVCVPLSPSLFYALNPPLPVCAHDACSALTRSFSLSLSAHTRGALPLILPFIPCSYSIHIPTPHLRCALVHTNQRRIRASSPPAPFR